MTSKEFAQFKKFVESGYARPKFTKELYRALNLSSFGFIAHYDLGGFYEARFAGWPERVETFSQILERDARGPFEQAVREYIKSERLLGQAAEAEAKDLEARERAELVRLTAKIPVIHTVTFNDEGKGGDVGHWTVLVDGKQVAEIRSWRDMDVSAKALDPLWRVLGIKMVFLWPGGRGETP